MTIELTAPDGTVDRQVWPARDSLGAATPVIPGIGLPAGVMRTLAELRPDQLGPSQLGSTQPGAMPAGEPELVRHAVEDVCYILRNRAAVKPVLSYAQYLVAVSAAFSFASSHFDRFNRFADKTAKDAGAIGTSPEELLCIANHLYVLRSFGLAGCFAECGAFKGFSTCCLSHACEWLGIEMHTFDSFEGLPPCGSDYYNEGEFRGTIDEVRENLRTFGRPEAVQLHQWYFSETLPTFGKDLICLWMDVDLESSSKDVMALLPLLNVGGCVFSHEISEDAVEGERPRRDVSEVLPPIIEAFSSKGSRIAARHLVGYLGAFWAEAEGLPVLGYEEISRIVSAAQLR